MRAKLLLCLLVIAMTPSMASATDYDHPGFLTLMVFVFMMIPGIIINLIVMIVFATRRRYASLGFALKHSCIASAVVLLGVHATLKEYSYNDYARSLTGDRNAALTYYAGLLVLAWVPMLLHVLTPRRAPASPAS